MSNQTNRPKPGALYALGILCLLPLIGFFAGVVFLILGIVHYKDKWFSLMGAFGIVWTIAIYSSLFYVGFYSSFGKNNFAKLSQQNLNGLVSEIEFYKIQHGNYPDSLKQLSSNNKFIFIHDVIPGKSLGGNDLYNYEKRGDKYVLFSSGVDGVPYTKDDLFPQVTISDSNKIGLIRP
jgi:hypothetical protein